MSARPQPQRMFVLRLTPNRGALLKTMLRRFGLRCVGLEEVPDA